MRASSSAAFVRATETNRSEIRLSEGTFGSIFTDIAIMLWPPPKTAAQVASAIGCTERSAELYLAGTQKWSGDAVAAIIAEVLKRHAMRNVRISAK